MIKKMNYDWSAPEILEPYRYANQFGEVVMTPVTGFMPVSDISIEKIPEINEVLVSLEDAEKVTLVTENRRGMMSFLFPFREDGRNMFGLQYSCRNRAAICRVEIIKFQTPGNISAAEQLEEMAPKTMGPMPIF